MSMKRWCFQEPGETIQVYEPCDRSSSMVADNGIENEDVGIRQGFGSASKKYAESSSDNDQKEHEFQDEQRQREVTQMEEDFTINKQMEKVEQSESTRNPQGMIG